VSDGRYRRTVALPASHGIIELEPVQKANAVLLRLQLSDLSDVSTLVQRCRHLFDLDAVPTAIADVLAADPLLAKLLEERPGLRVPGAMNGFELATRAILGQQVSVAGATTLAGRLARAVGEPLERPQGSLTHFFPTPQVLAQADLQGLGLTRGRIVALQALAQAVDTGEVVLERGADRAETSARLLQLPGVGPWTVAYIAMRALGDPDACPLSDLGLRRAFEQHGAAVDVRSIERRAEQWRPWRAYATHHLWASLSPIQRPASQRHPGEKPAATVAQEQESRLQEQPVMEGAR
jgi:AraC family transcriptional regulator of adaptative response / DNA-3-methyladenine glycosylase II